jgi:hypothetical protein
MITVQHVTPSQKDQPLLSLKSRPHFQTHKSSWNELKFWPWIPTGSETKNDSAGKGQQQFTAMLYYEIYYCHYANSGCHSNEMSIVSMLYERMSCHEHASSLFFHCIVSDLWVLTVFWCEHVICSVLYKGDGLRLTTCACYSWEMDLNVGPNVSLHNT